jgi:hypothetical protein
VRELILRITRDHYASRDATESRFDRILAELARDREEQARKWDEQAALWREQNRRWDEQAAERARDREEQARKWDEQNRKWDENQVEIRKLGVRLDNAIGGLGARWGLMSEAAFRDGLAAILRDSFGVEVVRICEWDEDGAVFGRPEQVEIDVVIRDGVLILCEIKSSMSRADVHAFDRKARFYEARRGQRATRKLIVTPYADERAAAAARSLGIELYGRADEVKP